MSAPGTRIGAAAGRPALRDVFRLIRFGHSVFALPFALMALLVAAEGAPGVRTAVLVVAAVVAARTAAMAYNRWADRALDAANPRTSQREIPRGMVSPGFTLGLAIGAAVVFQLCTWWLGPACFWLGFPVLAWLLAYSHTKRFTSLCHLWLGVSLGLAPVAAWVAVRGLGPDVGTAVLLGAGVALWVAGFDVLYACQDEAFDRRMGLHSVPARIGIPGALRVAGTLHLVAVGLFAGFGFGSGRGLPYHLGVLAAAGLLVWEHHLLAPGDLRRMHTAFFTANGLIGLALLGATCLDLYL